MNSDEMLDDIRMRMDQVSEVDLTVDDTWLDYANLAVRVAGVLALVFIGLQL